MLTTVCALEYSRKLKLSLFLFLKRDGIIVFHGSFPEPLFCKCTECQEENINLSRRFLLDVLSGVIQSKYGCWAGKNSFHCVLHTFHTCRWMRRECEEKGPLMDQSILHEEDTFLRRNRMGFQSRRGFGGNWEYAQVGTKWKLWPDDQTSSHSTRNCPFVGKDRGLL